MLTSRSPCHIVPNRLKLFLYRLFIQRRIECSTGEYRDKA